MSTKVAPLGLRLFLEGVEVPVISAQVNVVPDSPATAAIQVIPADSAMNLLPRTLVHLFYLDPDEVPTAYDTPRVRQENEENNRNRFDAQDNQYKLLFCGEVIGFDYGKSSEARQLVLQCMDLSSYWDTCYQWFADYSVGGGGLTDKSHQFVGAGASMFNSVAGGHQWVIGRIINSKPKSKAYKNAKGLLAGLIRLMEAIGGIRYTRDDPGFNGVNDFFTIAELRYNLLGMIGAVEKDDTSAKIYANKAFRSWLRNGMTRLGTLMSFRDILNHVNKLVYHNIYPNPAPYYIENVGSGKATVYSTIFINDKQNGKPLVASLRKVRESVTLAQTKFEHAVWRPAAYSYGQGAAVAASDELDHASWHADKLSTDDKVKVKTKLADIGSKLSTARAKGVRAGTLTDLAEQNIELMKETIVIIDDLLGTKNRSRRGRKTIQIPKRTHLYSQLILPELFFVPPPRCNVIFPDQYYQFNFSRNFMREVTRLSCRGGLGMIAGGRRGAKLLGSHYFAPNVKNSVGKNLYATWDKGARILMPHEVHSGIIPKFEWVTDGHRWGVKAANAAGDNSFYKSGKVGYVQRLANYQLYLHRWAARSISLTGVFNPNLVLGMPALVMDRSMPAPVVVKMFKEKTGRALFPTQYLGKISSFMHQVNQGGGQTSVQLNRCRTHRALDDEFMGVLMREKEEVKELTNTYKIDLQKLPDTGSSATASGGAQLRPGETNITSRGVTTGEGKTVRYFMGNAELEEVKKIVRKYIETQGGKIEGMRVKVPPGGKWVIKSITASGSFNLNEGGARKIGVTGDLSQKWAASILTEEVTQARFNVLSLPQKLTLSLNKYVGTGEYERLKDRTIEQCIRPGWYSDVWSNEKIGAEAYMPLIGVEAITDNIAVKAAEADELIDRVAKEEAVKVATKIDSKTKEGTFSYEETNSADDSGTIAVLNVQPGSIEEAVDSISILYGLVKSRGGDVHGLISKFTKRPIANMEQILGSPNIAVGEDGEIDASSAGGNKVEGFHTRAFGDYNTNVQYPTGRETKPKPGDLALHGLFEGRSVGSKPVERASILDRGEGGFSVKPELDPRGRARARVRAYIQELNVSRGLLG